MSKLGRAFRAMVAPFATKSLDAETLRAFMQGGTASTLDRCSGTYRSLVLLGYESNVNIQRAIGEISGGVASVPVNVFVGDDKQETHDLGTLIARPNIGKTKTRFLSELVSYYLLDGNAFVIAVPTSDTGKPLGLQTLRPDQVEVQRTTVGAMPATVYTYTPEKPAQPEKWVVRDDDDAPPILHIKAFSPFNKTRGQSPLLSARTAIDRHNLAEDWNSNMIRNGAKIPGVLLVEKGANDGALTTAERDALKKMVEEMVSGAKNASRPLVLEGGLKWQATGWSPTDIDWTGGKASAARDAVNALGYPPMLLGIPGDNTFSNQREARLALWENTIIPLLLMILDELSAWLGPRYGKNVSLRPDLDRVPALALRREHTWDMLKGVDFAAVNEQREIAGLDKDPSPLADQVLVSYAKVPLSELSRSVILAEETDPNSPEAGAEPPPTPAEE